MLKSIIFEHFSVTDFRCTTRLHFWSYLFNIFLNELLTTLENSEIYNFADNNTISSISKEKEALLTTLEKDSEKAIDWFR